jgi:hypothetical protein
VCVCLWRASERKPGKKPVTKPNKRGSVYEKQEKEKIDGGGKEKNQEKAPLVVMTQPA